MREHGLVAVLRKAASLAHEPLFDLRHGVDTRARVEVPDLDVSGPHVAHALRYEPIGHREMRRILRRLALPTDGVFCDMGCGKGRALMLAWEYGFRKVVGLELSAALTGVARENVRTFCRPVDEREVRVVHADVAEHVLGDDETVIFLFNPFDDVVMQAVVDQLRASLRRRPRTVWVVYFNARHRDVFERSVDFTRLGEYRMPCLDAVVYSNDAETPLPADHQGSTASRQEQRSGVA